MRNLNNELRNKIINFDKLLEYGFIEKNNQYVLKKKIYNEQFEMIVCFSEEQNTSKLIDIANEDEYILVDIQESSGEFVGRVREEYESKLQDIIEKCTTSNIFKSKQAKQVIQYIKEKYDDELEFLWQKFPKNAVIRHKKNKKWYAALLVLSKSKLGLEDDTIIDIIDLKNTKEEVAKLVDNKNFFAGYHMNKRHWFTIPLDGTVPIEEIFKYIDISYNIE